MTALPARLAACLMSAALAALALMIALPVEGADYIDDFDAEIPGYAGVTYTDLLRQVMPDVTIKDRSATGHPTIAIDNIENTQFNLDVPEVAVIQTLQVQAFESGGEPHLALMATMGEESLTMLAAFAMTDGPKLVDAKDVAMDRLNNFAENAVLRIGDDDEVLVTSSWHANAGESYDTNVLVMLKDGRLRMVDSFSSYGESTCQLQSVQDYGFAGTYEPNRPYYAITATLTEIGATDPTCEDVKQTEPYVQTQSRVYRWEAAADAYVKVAD